MSFLRKVGTYVPHYMASHFKSVLGMTEAIEQQECYTAYRRVCVAFHRNV